jgi:hypothetical protein
MNDELVAALADLAGVSLSPERAAAVAELLESLIREGGGTTPAAVAGVEPAIVFELRRSPA